MIVDALLAWLVDLLDWLAEQLRGLSLGNLSDSIPGDVSGAWGMLTDLSYFLPIPELLGAILTVVAIGPALLVTTVATWAAVGVARGGSPTA